MNGKVLDVFIYSSSSNLEFYSNPGSRMQREVIEVLVKKLYLQKKKKINIIKYNFYIFFLVISVTFMCQIVVKLSPS